MDEIQLYNYLNRIKPFFKRQESLEKEDNESDLKESDEIKNDEEITGGEFDSSEFIITDDRPGSPVDRAIHIARPYMPTPIGHHFGGEPAYVTRHIETLVHVGGGIYKSKDLVSYNDAEKKGGTSSRSSNIKIFL